MIGVLHHRVRLGGGLQAYVQCCLIRERMDSRVHAEGMLSAVKAGVKCDTGRESSVKSYLRLSHYKPALYARSTLCMASPILSPSPSSAARPARPAYVPQPSHPPACECLSRFLEARSPPHERRFPAITATQRTQSHSQRQQPRPPYQPLEKTCPVIHPRLRVGSSPSLSISCSGSSSLRTP